MGSLPWNGRMAGAAETRAPQAPKRRRGTRIMHRMHRIRRCLSLLAIGGLTSLLGGCFNPLVFGPLTPIPMPAWVADHINERLENKNDFRTPILPPIPPGFRPICEDPPGEAEILRAMPRVARGVPFIYEEHRDDIETTAEKMVDVIDPPRFFPLIGPAQLHHCHWKCTIYYNETLQSGYPFPFMVKRRRIEVVYIDKDHLHQCVSGPDAQGVVTRDMANGIYP
jgi:hypothetical protein